MIRTQSCYIPHTFPVKLVVVHHGSTCPRFLVQNRWLAGYVGNLPFFCFKSTPPWKKNHPASIELCSSSSVVTPHVALPTMEETSSCFGPSYRAPTHFTVLILPITTQPKLTWLPSTMRPSIRPCAWFADVRARKTAADVGVATFAQRNTKKSIGLWVDTRGFAIKRHRRRIR